MKNFNPFRFKTLFVVNVLLLGHFAMSQINCSPQTTYTNFDFLYSNTNAVSLTTSNHVESSGVSNYTVNVYTFTIPFFENSFTFNYLRFKNGVSGSNCKQPGSGYSCTSKIKVFNAHSGGSLIASVNNIAQLDLSNPLNVGVHNIRVEGTCGTVEFTNTDKVYRTAYYRIIVQKEQQPVLNLGISTACQKNNQNQNTGYVNFLATGAKPNNNKLYLKITPPANSSCAPIQLLIDNLSYSPTFTNQAFYNCNSNGSYSFKILYKSNRIGGGPAIAQEITPVGWTDFLWTKSFRNCMLTLDPAPVDFAFKLSPNPVKGILSIKIAENEKAESIAIYDFTGTMRKTTKGNNTDQIEIDLNDLEKGIYLLEITTSSGTYKEKIVKE